MDSDRLSQLKRQRELITEHLDWINAEIDRETFGATPSTTPKADRLAEAFGDSKPVEASLKELEYDLESSPSPTMVSDLYDELGPDAKGAAGGAKRGCLIMFALFLGSFAALVGWVYYHY